MSIRKYVADLDDGYIDQLDNLVDVFMKKNSQLNLSAIREQEGVEIKHVVDSLLSRDLDAVREAEKVLDLGTGGGFPGLLGGGSPGGGDLSNAAALM